MKLRSLICISAIAAVSAAFALNGGNTFARLKVDSGSITNSIIAIPFAGCGESTAEIYVTNLVMTAGLANGDTLMYKDGSGWHAWEIQGASAGTAGHWVGVSTSSKTTQTLATPAEEFKVACGKACWLMRSTPGAYYLYGQVTNALSSSVTVAGVASESNDQVAYTLVGYPTESAALNLKTWHPSGINAGDTLLIPDAAATGGRREYRSNGSAWCKITTKSNGLDIFGNPKYTTSLTPVSSLEGDALIAPGCGFMFGRKGQSELTLNWN